MNVVNDGLADSGTGCLDDVGNVIDLGCRQVEDASGVVMRKHLGSQMF